MFSFFQRPIPRRAGVGAAIVAVVALAGYGIGATQSSSATASAASAAQVASAAVPRVSTAGSVTSYAPIVDAVAPAVVTVRVEKRASIVPTQFPDDELFRFFGRQFQFPREQRVPRQSGLGSGVITTSDGYILTNNHVIDGADRVRVELTDKRSFDAKVVGTDPASDLAVLKIEGTDLPIASMGNSNDVRVGDVVLAIGNPLDIGQTVTMGIISAKGRATGIGDGSYEDFLQTDAPINRGNSGGALVNLEGEVVGINSQILTPTGGNIGLGFAIPSNMAREIMEQLKSEGAVSRGKLGVTVQSVTADIAASLNLPSASGAIVSGVEPASAAARAGLKQGDVVTALNGETLADSNALRNRIASTKPGSTIELDVFRNGRTEKIRATLGELERPRTRASAEDGESNGGEFGVTGMTVSPLTSDLARQLGVPGRTEGVVVREVEPDGIAASAGLRPGDVITQVDGKPVTAPGELKSALSASGTNGRPALLLVTRQNADIFVTLRYPRT